MCVMKYNRQINLIEWTEWPQLSYTECDKIPNDKWTTQFLQNNNLKYQVSFSC